MEFLWLRVGSSVWGAISTTLSVGDDLATEETWYDLRMRGR